MKFTYIIWIGLIVILLIGFLLFFFFRKKAKTEKELLTESRNQISLNAQTINILLVSTQGNDSLTISLQKLQDDLRYLTPSVDVKVKQIDVKIKNVLDDFRIYLAKGANEDKGFIKEIELLLAERSTLTQR